MGGGRRAVITEALGGWQSAASGSGPPPVGETCSSPGGFVSSKPQRHRARPARHKAPRLLRVLPDGLLHLDERHSANHKMPRRPQRGAARAREPALLTSGARMAKRSQHRASEGHDARSERPATGHGRPRACAPDEPAASRPVGFIEAILFDTGRQVTARKLCQGSLHDPYSPQAFSLHPADGADRNDDAINPASTDREGKPCF